MKFVKMVQHDRYTWSIVSPSGAVLQENLKLNNAYYAKEYIANYITSFTGWSYELVHLPEIKGVLDDAGRLKNRKGNNNPKD